jgi:hypothetical protein
MCTFCNKKNWKDIFTTVFLVQYEKIKLACRTLYMYTILIIYNTFTDGITSTQKMNVYAHVYTFLGLSPNLHSEFLSMVSV